MAHDFIGEEIKVGDRVVFMLVGYRQLRIGTIKSIGKKKVTIEYGNEKATTTAIQFFNQIMKVEGM